MMIDTHSHLNFKAYDKDREDVVKRTQGQGVVCIDIGTKYQTSKRAVELAEKYENIYASIGMHPIHIKTDLLKIKLDPEEGAFEPFGEDFDKSKYIELAKNTKKVVAIGEIGLDYYYKPKTKTRLERFKENQKNLFLEQLKMAKELELPIIVHCRMAHSDVLEILSARGGPASSGENLKGVIHCFTGNLEEAKKYIELGFYLGINGIIDKLDLSEVIKRISIDKILVETDCPYLTPKEEGDKRNEPIFVKHVIQRIADLKKISFEEVAEKTTQNAKELFKI